MLKRLAKAVFSLDIATYYHGYAVLACQGQPAINFFKSESGGHRWQRIPPTERSGRVQTSTVTVAVLPGTNNSQVKISPADLRWDTFRAGGPGGQHQNKVETGVRVTHIPSGTVVVCTSERSQYQNKQYAMDILKGKIEQQKNNHNRDAVREARKAHGTGERGDKIRTYSEKHDTVSDHRTGRKTSLKELYKGNWAGIK